MSIELSDLPEKYQTIANKMLGNPVPEKKKSKYNAHRTWVDGIAFDSQKEADYYCYLKTLLAAGEIDGFTYHGNFICTAGDKDHRGTMYETDFIVFKDGKAEIIDTKGVRTDAFKLKVKMLREKYPNLEVRLV